MRGRHTRRLLAVAGLVTALLLSLGLAACGGGPDPRVTATPTRTPKPAVTSTSLPMPSPSSSPSPTPSASPTAPPTATPTSTDMPVDTESATPTETPTEVPTETPAATATLPPSPTLTPGVSMLAPATPVTGLQPIFDNRIWVGLYGTPGSRGLGILGTAPAMETVTMTVQQALAYQELLTGTQVVPFFHMVVTIADPFPGPDSSYSHRVTTGTIQSWINVASAHGVFSVLDIQPGHSPITSELAFVEPFVRQLGVHVAIDPEFLMAEEGQVPGRRIGLMTGAQVNLVQAWLNGIAEATGERKALIIHQFDDRMFTGKEELVDYPLVELVWDADGFGGPGPKIADYRQYAAEPGFEYGGFKLFYDYDVPLMSPADVLRLEPRPVFVVYQ